MKSHNESYRSNISRALLLGSGLILILAALLYNELFLALFVSAPLLRETVAKIRSVQVYFLLSGLVLIFVSECVRRMSWLGILMKKTFVNNILLAILSVFLPLFILEFSLRPFVGFEPKTASHEELRIAPKQAGIFRIFVYGGSTVAGEPITSFGFVSQLEFWLREIHPEKRLEVFNLGVSGEASSYVLRKVEQTITYKPDLLIVLTGHNEFLRMDIESPLKKVLDKLALKQALVKVRHKIVKDPFEGTPHEIIAKDNLRPPVDRDSKLFKWKVKKYIENLHGIAQIAIKKNIPLIIATPPSNLADWPPTYTEVTWDLYDEEYKSGVSEAAKLVANEPSKKTIIRLEELLRTYKDDAMLLYLLGRAHLALGNYDTAGTMFIKAKDLEPLPWRALSEFNQAVRNLANDDLIYVADIESIFQHYARNGIVGFSLIADNVHPTPLGNAIIARELVRIMGEHKLFVEKDVDFGSLQEQLDYFMTKTLSLKSRRGLEILYLIKNAKYTMKVPFSNYTASKMYLQQALALDPYKWTIWVNLATISLLENRIEQGREELKKAIKLKGGKIDPEDRENAPHLKEALVHSGIILEDIQ